MVARQENLSSTETQSSDSTKKNSKRTVVKLLMNQ